MKLFSERVGYRRPESGLQLDCMTPDLRLGLWNAVVEYCLPVPSVFDATGPMPEDMAAFSRGVFAHVFARDMRDVGHVWERTRDLIQQWFFECCWFEAFDFLEFCLAHAPPRPGTTPERFARRCSFILERERSVYRFVGGHLTRTVHEAEVDEIYGPPAEHPDIALIQVRLRQAFELLADHRDPDLSRCLAEAREAILLLPEALSDGRAHSLGDALEELNLPGAFVQRLARLLESAAAGSADEPALEDARFALVAAVSLVNYLAAKVGRAHPAPALS